MAHSLSKVYVHIVFSTKHRQPFIDDQIEDDLFRYLGGVCNALECPAIQVGGYKDHVHVFCLLSRKISQASLLEELKKRSSKWIKQVSPKYEAFYWQNGYGIFSVSPSNQDAVIQYIRNQRAHHEK